MKNNKTLWLLIFFLAAWGVYLKTLCPTLYVGDTGELIGGSYLLGIPHPPGYPLYELTGHLFSWLPLGEIAWRYNLFSAFFTALAVSGLAYFLNALFRNFSLATALALLWGWGAAHWEMGASAEVYPIASFLFILFLISLYHWKHNHQPHNLYLAALTFGLGLAAHYTFLLFLPGTLLYLLMSAPLKKLGRASILLLFLGLLGWLTFIYLPLRAIQQPPINWGNCLNFTNLSNHLQRAEYHEVAARRDLAQFKRQFAYLGIFLRSQFPLFTGFIAFLGWPLLFRRDRAEFWLFGGISLVFVLVGAFFLNYELLSIALGFGPKFYLPLYALLLVYLGAGLSWGITKTGKWAKHIFVLLLILPLFSFRTAYPRANLREHRLARYLGLDILRTPPAGAVFFVEEEDNELFILTYCVNVLGLRPDLRIFDPYANLFPKSYAAHFNLISRRPPDLTLRALVEKWTQTRPEFQPAFYTIKPYLNAPFKLTGLLYAPSETEAKLNQNIWRYYHYQGWPTVPLNYWSRYVAFSYPFHRGEAFLKAGQTSTGLAALNEAYDHVKDMQWLAFNTGVILQENGLLTQAATAYQAELTLGAPNRNALINLGSVYSLLNRSDLALNTFKKALLLGKDPDLLNALGNIYYRFGNHRQAREHYQQARELAPASIDIRFNYALNEMELGKPQAAAVWQQFLTDFQGRLDPETLRNAQQHLAECRS